jgi:hypothetical protein
MLRFLAPRCIGGCHEENLIPVNLRFSASTIKAEHPIPRSLATEGERLAPVCIGGVPEVEFSPVKVNLIPVPARVGALERILKLSTRNDPTAPHAARRSARDGAEEPTQTDTTRRSPTRYARLLSRGSQVRYLPGAPFPKEFAKSTGPKIIRFEQSECPAKKLTGPASLRHNSHFLFSAFFLSNFAQSFFSRSP